MNKLYSIILLSTLLTACGSDSENSIQGSIVDESQPSNLLLAPLEIQPAVTEFRLEENKPLEILTVIESTVKRSSEITVPDGFLLSSERTFSLKIVRIEDDNQAAYLSLCTDYKHHNDGSYSINYDSCLLRTSLSDINYESLVTVTNDTEGLVVALWFMDVTKKPIITSWRF